MSNTGFQFQNYQKNRRLNYDKRRNKRTFANNASICRR